MSPSSVVSLPTLIRRILLESGLFRIPVINIRGEGENAYSTQQQGVWPRMAREKRSSGESIAADAIHATVCERKGRIHLDALSKGSMDSHSSSMQNATI